ncbi:MAG TPA: histidinol dehydrogenase [Polyangiaceae bacterium]|nr:histidinol dehydrogenase [Polyangiaceae bacterium]
MKPEIYDLPNDRARLDEVLKGRQGLLDPEELARVSAIFADVRQRGDTAIREITQKFDKIELSSLRISASAADEAVAGLTPDLATAIEVCRARMAAVNAALMPSKKVEHRLDEHTLFGETCTALDSVAVWVPCRKGPLVSTALMLVVAAQVAGVPRIALCTPPLADGKPDPATMAAARIAGATEFYVGNGVALLAGLTLGTESLTAVAGMFGPGPSGITLAMGIAGMYGKKTCLGLGPSDCLVLCDETADPRFVALDLMTEAEHGPDSSALLVTTSRALAERVQAELSARIAEVAEPRRSVLQKIFGPGGRGALAVCPSLDACIELTNAFAPEHMQIACSAANTERVLASSPRSGEILIGQQTPFSSANYALGITAVLPTNGYARSLSGVTSRDMLRYSTLGSLDAAGLAKLVPSIGTLARYEGLPCHAEASEARPRYRDSKA